jgi:hypothetical protein
MPGLPKIKLEQPLYPFEEMRDFKEAQYFLFSYGADAMIVVEGQVINSYEEFVQLAAQDCYKDREFLEVVLLPTLIGGG